jgi:2-polyprenyl-3-methyl-5-hydroxy-6-metoxy-1,4-benzoquinol methylase
MIQESLSEKDLWSRVTDMLGNGSKRLGRHWSYNLRNDPKRLAFVLARYKFAARMASKNHSVLELGCSEGIGCPIVIENARSYLGVDLDESAVETARQNWEGDKCKFHCCDFLGKTLGKFDAIISLDVIEHIHPEDEDLFFKTVYDNLDEDGICVIGTPNITSAAYASPASQRGHINLYDANRLAASMGKIFHNVFRFGMNDEVAHTGYDPMAHYLMHVGCYKRRGEDHQ